ncbi:MAG: hypothetical protein D6732_27330 [Methanobacteriota archaeon]|nr:MAG: hypothetical protein D6732_27330 [Euryarchaeota archaeon]
MNFSVEWLLVRKPYDDVARNGKILQSLLESLPPSTEQLVIWDLGAGICNSSGTFPFLFFKAGYSSQKWFFIEKDETLLNAAISNIRSFFPALTSKTCFIHENCILVFHQKEDEIFEGHLINTQIQNLNRSHYGSPDIFMANAVFDIVNEDLIRYLVSQFNDCVWYSSLNHRKTHLLPKDSLDFIAKAYDEHTIAQYPERLGIQTCIKVPEILSESGFIVRQGSSTWRIDKTDDPAIFSMLWQFIQEVALEMNISETLLEQSKNQCHQIIVDHCDFLAVPKIQ